MEKIAKQSQPIILLGQYWPGEFNQLKGGYQPATKSRYFTRKKQEFYKELGTRNCKFLQVFSNFSRRAWEEESNLLVQHTEVLL